MAFHYAITIVLRMQVQLFRGQMECGLSLGRQPIFQLVFPSTFHHEQMLSLPLN